MAKTCRLQMQPRDEGSPAVEQIHEATERLRNDLLYLPVTFNFITDAKRREPSNCSDTVAFLDDHNVVKRLHYISQQEIRT